MFTAVTTRAFNGAIGGGAGINTPRNSMDSAGGRMLMWNTSLPTTTFDPERTVYSSSANGTDDQMSKVNNARAIASILVPIFFTIIVCVGILGNSLVITVMTKLHRHHGQGLSNTNRFILNLAISDLLFLIFCVPFHAPVYTLDEWIFGGFLCKFSKYCEVMTMISSIYTMVALSVDRFLAVVYATSARQVRTRTNAIRGLIFIWIASIGIAAPATIAHGYAVFRAEGEVFRVCGPYGNFEKWYEFSLFILGYISPLLVIICCYMGLLLSMCKNARKSAVAKNASSNDARKRVTRIVILVVIVFAICWFPNHLFHLMRLNDKMQYTSTTFVLRLVSHCMSYANSCLNPLIYAFVSKKFRNDFKKAFTCQYFTEAVINMKAISQRMISTIGGTVRRGTRRGTATAEQEVSVEIASAGGTVARTIQQRNAFCPRSPVMCYNPHPSKCSFASNTLGNEEEKKSLFTDGDTKATTDASKLNLREEEIV